jgi:hypothetical protein
MLGAGIVRQIEAFLAAGNADVLIPQERLSIASVAQILGGGFKKLDDRSPIMAAFPMMRPSVHSKLRIGAKAVVAASESMMPRTFSKVQRPNIRQRTRRHRLVLD